MKIGKYNFDSKEQTLSKIEALGVDEEGNPTHKHAIVMLGNIVLEAGQYDEEGVEITAPVISDKFHVDVLWQLNDTVDEEGNTIKADHPFGWKTYSVDLGDNGVHSFSGVNFVDNKFQ